MKHLSLALLLLLAGSAETAAAQDAAEPSTVKLAFSWPPGLQASVTSTRTRTRVAQDRSTYSGTGRYSLRVLADGDRLRIEAADFAFEPGDGLKALPASAQAQIAGQVADLAPAYLVTKAGEFVGLHDLPALKTRIRAWLVGLLPKELDASLAQQLEALAASEAVLNARAAEHWNSMVGSR